MASKDDYSTYSCDWCGADFAWKHRNEKTVDSVVKYLCKWCSQFDTKAEMEAMKAEIIAEAIRPEMADRWGYPWI